MCAYSLDHITSRSLRLYVVWTGWSKQLISHICERDIFKLETNYQNNKQNRLKITAFKQKTFQIVKEHTMRRASRDHPSSQWTKPTWARVIARSVQVPRRCGAKGLVEPAGIEPATFWLQTRRSPS